ncbi:MFS general substrate transporter [Trametes gibbosa]|nr:MFS general substrate transporter [Trametes gibbosa]
MTTHAKDSTVPDDHTVVESRSETVSLTDQTNLLPRKKVIAVFFGLSLCILVSCLDSTIVATALPTISAAFNAGSVVSWVPSAYFLTSTAFQPLYGRFSDIFGRKAALCMAMGIFMIGSLAAGFSRNITELILLRGLAGAGGGGIVSMAQIVISDVVSLRDRGKYQGIIGVVVAFGFAVGPLLGGALAEKAGWRWCFWVTLPISACAGAVVILVLPLKQVEGNIVKKLAVVDYLGAALTLVSCTLFILPLIWGGVTFPWTSPVVLAPLFAGVLALALFCLWEWKGARLPIVPMYIFKQVTVTGVYITMLINGFVFYSSLFYLPQYFQVGLGHSAIRSGVFLLPVLVSQTLASFISGQIITWTGRYRATIYVGFGIWTVACGCLSTVTPATSKGVLVFFMLLAGTGAGGTLQTTTVAAQASVSRRDMSVVTAVRNFIRLLGGTLSLAIGATIINNSLRYSMTTLGLPSSTISAIVDDPTILGAHTSASDSAFAKLGVTAATADRILGAYIQGFRTVFILNASLNAVATIAAIVLIRHIELTRGDEEDLRKRAADESAQVSEKSSIMETKAESSDSRAAAIQNI